MKTITTFLLSLSILPAGLSAQPVLSGNEFYYSGEVIQMLNCNTAGVVAGDTGSNVTWDFSGLTSPGGTLTTTILNDTSAVFSTSNLMEVLPNGSIAFLRVNNTDSYLNGVYDTTSHVTTTYALYDVAKRPITYLNNYVDSYKVNVASTGEYGTGRLYVIADGYGTLLLPGGATYTNVLRIRKEQVEYDTVGTTPSLIATTSYLWFDTGSRPPLLRIDSVIGSASESQTVMYLLPPEGVPTVKGTQAIFTGYFDNSEHLLVGGFEAGKDYRVVVYNVIGNKVFSENFSATGSSERFDLSRRVNPGIYIVSISMKTEPYGSSVFKVVKTQ